jgi:hypothetical protein
MAVILAALAIFAGAVSVSAQDLALPGGNVEFKSLDGELVLSGHLFRRWS